MKTDPQTLTTDMAVSTLVRGGHLKSEGYETKSLKGKKGMSGILAGFRLSFGIACAAALHVGFILFGGQLFFNHKQEHSTPHQVELLSENDIISEKKKPVEEETETPEEMETEQAPDASEVIRNLELSAAVNAPELEAASLSAIEAALSGQTCGDGVFAEALSFSSGGRIGGTGKGSALDDGLEKAFSLTEIDQKPRAIFQAAPVYPAGRCTSEVVVSVVFIVDTTGKVTHPRVEKSTDPAFEKPAVDAVKQWKFEPAVKAGQRVSCKMRVPIRFQPR